MSEFDIPITLTFKGKASAYDFISSLDGAQEQVIWEQRVTEEGTVIVSLLNIISQIEKDEEDDLDGDL